VWITSLNSLKCTTPQEIYLLLKSSDFISHDLHHAYDNCLPPLPPKEYELVLKEWYDLVPSMEFRAFVRDRNLIAISQRDCHYYPFLRALEPKIRRLVGELFHSIRGFDSENWVFDCYIPRTRKRAHLIDMNPFAPRTDAGLFTWEEVLGMSGEGSVEVRFVGEEGRGIGGIEFSAQRVPMEVVEVSQGKNVVEFAVEWERMLREGVEDSDSKSENE
jgi:D123